MIPFLRLASSNKRHSRAGLVLRMRQMVYSSKDFESLWFLYQAEGLPKNISIEELTFPLAVELNLLHKARSSWTSQASGARADFPTFDKWYRKTHKKVCPVTGTGMPAEECDIQSEAAKVSEESDVHDPVRHPFKYPTDRVQTSIRKSPSA